MRTVHPFPARMASEVALKALEGLRPGSSVLDPMCGSGVVVRRALELGHHAVGLDIDPLAVLMARVWTSKIPSCIQSSLALELVQQARMLSVTEIELPWIDQDRETANYVDFWFAQTQRIQIRALLAAGDYLRHQRKDLLHLALSRTIVTKSKGASLAADTSHSRPHRVRIQNDYDVFDGFVRSFIRILQLQQQSPPQVQGRIFRGDATTLRGLKPSTIDAVVTSPPYLTAIDYLRGHKLALVWLGYTVQRLREIKAHSVGCSNSHNSRDSSRILEIVQAVAGKSLAPALERTVWRYTRDMRRCLRQVHRVLRPGGYAVYVVSNSVTQGTEIDTTSIVMEAAHDAGLQFEDRYTREIPKEHRYLPPPETSPNIQLAARMKTESFDSAKSTISN